MIHCKFARIYLCLLGLLVLLIPSGLAVATGIDGGIERETGGYRFNLVFDEHPQTGPNNIKIRIIDSDGIPVMGAAVQVSPLKASGDHHAGVTESHGEAQEAHAEAETEGHEGHTMPTEAGHSDVLPEIEHAGTGDHQEMESGSHEEAGGHAEPKSVSLKASKEAGLYTGKISFTEPGDWLVSVRVVLEDATEQELQFPLDIIDAGPPWGVLSSFFGINLAVMGVAGLLKRKSAADKNNFKGRA